MEAPIANVLERLDRLMAEMSAVREELTRLELPHMPSMQVAEWAQKVNAAINDPTLSQKEREEVVKSVPTPLRHAVAAECYRANKNVTFGWVAAIAGVLALEVPDLLHAHGVEPEFA